MKFSQWAYTRPDYPAVQAALAACRDRLTAAAEYAELRSAWLGAKQLVERMEYTEEIIYIRYLCGLDYEIASSEVAVQSAQDPAIYALRDACDALAAQSRFLPQLRAEFGDSLFDKPPQAVQTDVSLALRSQELALKMKHRALLAAPQRDDALLFDNFAALIRTRQAYAAALGLGSYSKVGYAAVGRTGFGEPELSHFRSEVQRCVTPPVYALKKSGSCPSFPRAVPQTPAALVEVISAMFHDLSPQSGTYIDEITSFGLYDLDMRENKPKTAFSCCMIPERKLPFIIGNYSGDALEAGYIVHEFGHGFAFYEAARNQPLYELHRATPSVNELHAKTMEHFMYPYLDAFVGNGANAYIACHLLRQLENLPYRCAVDEFEHTLYGLDDLSQANITALWIEILGRYAPWYLDEKAAAGHRMTWPHQTHIVDAPFYYIEYDIAQLGTFEFYSKMKHDRAAAWRDYTKLIAAGGSKPRHALFALAGLTDPFAEHAVRDICTGVIAELTNRL